MKGIARRGVYAVDRVLYSRGLRSPEALTLPDFLGLGPGQSGSTWLFEHLASHPDVYIPPEKELFYFDQRLHRRSLASYASTFEAARGRVAGEITPGYCVLRPERIAWIRRITPQVRLILTVRDPVERSWSAARRVMQRLGRSLEDFGEAEFREYLVKEWQYRPKGGPRIRGDYQPGLLEGHYSRVIENWLRNFPSEQLLVVFFERLKRDPEGFLAEVCDHIGVRTTFAWDPDVLRKRVNPNPRLDMPKWVRSFLDDLYAEEIERLHRCLGEPARQWLRAPGTPYDPSS